MPPPGFGAPPAAAAPAPPLPPAETELARPGSDGSLHPPARPAHPPKAVPVANPTNPPPGFDGASSRQPDRPGPAKAVPVVDPVDPPPGGAAGIGAHHPPLPPGAGGAAGRASDELATQLMGAERPPDPPPGGGDRHRPPLPPDAGATSVLDPSALNGRPGVSFDDPGGATTVIQRPGGFDPSSTTVFDPSAAGHGGSGPGSPTSSPGSHGSSADGDDGQRSDRRGLVLTLIGVMVVAAVVVLVLQPFARFGQAPEETTTTTGPDDTTTTGDDSVPEEEMVDPIEVPDLIGQPIDRATVRLLALGFEVATEADDQSDEPAGTVVGQSVAGGEVAEGGSSILLTVSGGEDGLTIPDIVGLPRSEAGPIFVEQGFTEVDVQEEPSQTLAAGSVIRTEPPPGTPVSTDTPIVVVISTGLEIATVPDVVGRTEAEATGILEGAGFDVEVVDGTGQEGVVLSQTPGSGGQRVLPFTIIIEVGRSG